MEAVRKGPTAPLARSTARVRITLALVEESRAGAGTQLERSRVGAHLGLPLMWWLATWARAKRRIAGRSLQTNSILFDGFSSRLRAVRSGATSWRALEVIYDHAPGQKGWRARLEAFWLSSRNAQAVRNRLRICERVLLDACPTARPVRMLSLAAGSAPAALAVAAELHGSRRLGVLWMLDLDAEAVEAGLARASRLGLSERVHGAVGDVLRFHRHVPQAQPDVIEMVGFLDYLEDRQAVGLLRRLLARLEPGGALVTGHIHPNSEAPFLREVVDWGRSPVMLYRTREALIELLVQAGAADIAAYTEPHRIHTIVVARPPR